MWDLLLAPLCSVMQRWFWIYVAQSLYATQESLCCSECHRNVPGRKQYLMLDKIIQSQWLQWCLWFGRQTYISFFRVWVFQRWEQGHNPKGMELLCSSTNCTPAKMKSHALRLLSDFFTFIFLKDKAMSWRFLPFFFMHVSYCPLKVEAFEIQNHCCLNCLRQTMYLSDLGRRVLQQPLAAGQSNLKITKTQYKT